MRKRLKILDLFAGIGGTATGIIKCFHEKRISFTYTAVERDDEIADAFLENVNHRSEVSLLRMDVRQVLKRGFVQQFDFVWASPPCQAHSRANWRAVKARKIDMLLWDVIEFLRKNAKNYVVENVIPWYEPPIKWSTRIGRHVFWSNFPIVPFRPRKLPKDFDYWGVGFLSSFYGLKPPQTKDGYKKRQSLRNVVDPEISYQIIKQFLKPRQMQLEVIVRD